MLSNEDTDIDRNLDGMGFGLAQASENLWENEAGAVTATGSLPHQKQDSERPFVLWAEITPRSPEFKPKLNKISSDYKRRCSSLNPGYIYSLFLEQVHLEDDDLSEGRDFPLPAFGTPEEGKEGGRSDDSSTGHSTNSGAIEGNIWLTGSDGASDEENADVEINSTKDDTKLLEYLVNLPVGSVASRKESFRDSELTKSSLYACARDDASTPSTDGAINVESSLSRNQKGSKSKNDGKTKSGDVDDSEAKSDVDTEDGAQKAKQVQSSEKTDTLCFDQKCDAERSSSSGDEKSSSAEAVCEEQENKERCNTTQDAAPSSGDSPSHIQSKDEPNKKKRTVSSQPRQIDAPARRVANAEADREMSVLRAVDVFVNDAYEQQNLFGDHTASLVEDIEPYVIGFPKLQYWRQTHGLLAEENDLLTVKSRYRLKRDPSAAKGEKVDGPFWLLSDSDFIVSKVWPWPSEQAKRQAANHLIALRIFALGFSRSLVDSVLGKNDIAGAEKTAARDERTPSGEKEETDIFRCRMYDSYIAHNADHPHYTWDQSVWTSQDAYLKFRRLLEVRHIEMALHSILISANKTVKNREGTELDSDEPSSDDPLPMSCITTYWKQSCIPEGKK